jgi:hypothetical protein
MSKKTNMRQTQVITLTDYHREEIKEINRDKENMLKEYEKKKEGFGNFNQIFLYKENFFLRITFSINEERTIFSTNKT